MSVYLDNAATSPLCESAKKAMTDSLEIFANPSSTHKAGIECAKYVALCRASLAKALRCNAEQIIFESCGSEANNHAIKAALALRSRAPKRIITTDSEHPSVYNTLCAYRDSGYEVVELSTVGGEIDPDMLANELQKGCALVSVMHANNETGAIYDIKKIRRIIDASKSGALLHCDDVQGFLKAPSVTSCCDFLTVSAHKIGGPKGIAALYTNQKRVLPLIYGGEQENGRRAGTENITGIEGFAAACNEWMSDTERGARISALRDDAAERIKLLFGDRATVLQPKERIGGMLAVSLNISLGGRKAGSEVLHNALSAREIYVSYGSACHGAKKDSRVLKAYGLKDSVISGMLRISFGYQNNMSDVDALVLALAELI